MTMQFKCPKSVLAKPSQLINYYAVEIVEQLTACPTEKEIQTIEAILRKFKSLTHSQDALRKGEATAVA